METFSDSLVAYSLCELIVHKLKKLTLVYQH